MPCDKNRKAGAAMHSVIGQENCCGCGACSQICPKKCIHIEQDQKGFWRTNCNSDQCIECGLCYNVCPLNNTSGQNRNEHDCYAAVSMDTEVYARSSSGGIFPLLAKKIISENGYVWGCGYSEELLPMHKGINHVDDLDDLCRSKYAQSYLGDSYSKIKNQLTGGYKVLFCGTPCQVAGLKNYLKTDWENLYLVDLVCHGVPSAGLFQKNIKYIEHKLNKKIDRYEFRLKGNDNTFYNYFYRYNDGTAKTAPYYKDPYFNAFYETISLNDVCYECPYACENRVGDLTIGDYEWGKKYHKAFDRFSEISCIIVNNSKGHEMLEWITNQIQLEKTEWEWIVERNKNLIRPTVRPVDSENFYEQIEQKGYEKWADNYFMSTRYIKKTKLVRKISNIKRKILQHIK